MPAVLRGNRSSHSSRVTAPGGASTALHDRLLGNAVYAKLAAPGSFRTPSSVSMAANDPACGPAYPRTFNELFPAFFPVLYSHLNHSTQTSAPAKSQTTASPRLRRPSRASTSRQSTRPPTPARTSTSTPAATGSRTIPIPADQVRWARSFSLLRSATAICSGRSWTLPQRIPRLPCRSSTATTTPPA